MVDLCVVSVAAGDVVEQQETSVNEEGELQVVFVKVLNQAVHPKDQELGAAHSSWEHELFHSDFQEAGMARMLECSFLYSQWALQHSVEA